MIIRATSSVAITMIELDTLGRTWRPMICQSGTPTTLAASAKALGPHAVVILKNHGLVAVGPSVEDATVLAVSFDRRLRLQLAAGQLGRIEPISPEEVQTMAEYFDRSYAGRFQTIWEYLRRKAQAG